MKVKSTFTTTEKYAKNLDLEDPLAKFRSRFFIPKDTIYLDGNSLGLFPRDAEKCILRVMKEWKTLGIQGWFESERPWWYYGENLGAIAAPLVGAEPNEVVATGTTTINLHSLVSTFYHPKGKKTKILADELDFPTDIYALKSQLKLKGLNPEEHLVLAPSNGRFFDEKKIVELMTEEIALVMLPSALYRSGQLLDMAYLTKEAHTRDIPIGFDCCHSVGAVPHYFDDWGVDFAVWCSYKYLNSGPGGTAFLYINKKHFNKDPGLTGWFGYVKEKQFEMLLDFEHAKSAGGWQMSSSNILCSAPIEGALDVMLEAGIERIREKSIKLTEYLIHLTDHLLAESPYNFEVGTPRDPDRRTGHIALEHDEAFRISEALKARGVVTDYRPPNIVRVAPVALYNTYHEVWKIVQILQEIIDNREYENIFK
ncbi:MAG: kynureninase [Candidatus Heimdallarchaeota archaeon]|nr:MAG: kynureninase [Candidatus Heimdallarchaeota archaeon]